MTSSRVKQTIVRTHAITQAAHGTAILNERIHSSLFLLLACARGVDLPTEAAARALENTTRKTFAEHAGNACEELNKAFAAYSAESGAAWVDEAEGALIALLDTHLVLAIAGSMHALMTTEGSMIDLTASLPAEERRPSPMRFFSSLIEGALPVTTRLVVCNNAFLEHVSKERLTKILASQDLKKTVEKLRDSLKEKGETLMALFLEHARPTKEDVALEFFDETPSHFEKPKRSAFQNRFSITQRVAVGLGCTALVLFAVSLRGVNLSEKNVFAKKQQTEAAKQFELALSTLEATLIYGNETLARTHLARVNELFERLERDAQNIYRTRLQESAQKLEKIELPTSANVFARHPSNEQSALVFFGEHLGVLARADTAALTIFNTDGTIKETPDLNLKNLTAVTSSEKYIFLVSDQNEVSRVPFEEITKRSLGQLKESSRRLVFYEDRLYSTDGSGIFRYDISESYDSIKSGVAWLKTPLETVNDFTIDGDVYVSSKDAIRKFFRGQPAEWKGDIPDGDHSFIRLWTNSETSDLFALDTATQRVLVFDKKTGALKKQLPLPDEMKPPLDMLVDLPRATIFLLDEAGVWKITL